MVLITVKDLKSIRGKVMMTERRLNKGKKLE